MRMLFQAVLPCALIALTGCGGANDETMPPDPALAEETAMEPTASPDAEPTATASATASAQPLSIPPRFQGRWAADAAACDDFEASVEGLTVTATELRFHESMGRATAIRSEGADTLIATADFEGEGERWTRDISMALTDNDQRMNVTNDGTAFARVKCPA